MEDGKALTLGEPTQGKAKGPCREALGKEEVREEDVGKV